MKKDGKRFLAWVLSAVILAMSAVSVNAGGFADRSGADALYMFDNEGKILAGSTPPLYTANSDIAQKFADYGNLPVLKEATNKAAKTRVTPDGEGKIYAKFVPERTGRYLFYLKIEESVSPLGSCSSTGLDVVSYDSSFNQSGERFGNSIYMTKGKEYYLDIHVVSVWGIPQNLDISVAYVENCTLSYEGNLRRIFYSGIDTRRDHNPNFPGIFPKILYTGECEETCMHYRTINGNTIEYRLQGKTSADQLGTFRAQMVLTDARTQKKQVLDLGNIEVQSYTRLPSLKDQGTVNAVMDGYGRGWFRLETGKGKIYNISNPYDLIEAWYSTIDIYRGPVSASESPLASFDTGFFSNHNDIPLEPNTTYYICVGFTIENLYYPIDTWPKKMNITVIDKSAPSTTTSLSTCTVTTASSAVYTGKAIKPAVQIKNGSTTLKQGTDFTVKYSNNVKLGSSATVTITGKGKYTGTVKKTFKIVLGVPKLISAAAAGGNSVKVAWNKVTGAKTYKLFYKESGSSKWSGVKSGISGTSYTHTSDKLQGGKQYIYTVRAVNGANTSGFDKKGVSVAIPVSAVKLTMTGVVTNSATGKGLAGVTLNFRKGTDQKTGSVYAKISSGAGGSYSADLQEGKYTVQLSKAGYVTTYTNMECRKASSGSAVRVDLSISPKLSTGQYRIVLSWGEMPEDLDAHLTGPTVSGERFHIFYHSPNAADNGKQVAKVDVDDKNSYGPETVTVNLGAGAPGIYRYYVHDYSNKYLSSSDGLAKSGARVTVYKGGKQVAAYSVPDQAGTKWHVFNIRNGKVVPINKMFYEKSPGNFQ